ncbi:unnamed protein product [Cutaneotrichosporon oleaginosum]
MSAMGCMDVASAQLRGLPHGLGASAYGGAARDSVLGLARLFQGVLECAKSLDLDDRRGAGRGHRLAHSLGKRKDVRVIKAHLFQMGSKIDDIVGVPPGLAGRPGDLLHHAGECVRAEIMLVIRRGDICDRLNSVLGLDVMKGVGADGVGAMERNSDAHVTAALAVVEVGHDLVDALGRDAVREAPADGAFFGNEGHYSAEGGGSATVVGRALPKAARVVCHEGECALGVREVGAPDDGAVAKDPGHGAEREGQSGVGERGYRSLEARGSESVGDADRKKEIEQRDEWRRGKLKRDVYSIGGKPLCRVEGVTVASVTRSRDAVRCRIRISGKESEKKRRELPNAIKICKRGQTREMKRCQERGCVGWRVDVADSGVRAEEVRSWRCPMSEGCLRVGGR